jgi:putative glutamine amidotransferase
MEQSPWIGLIGGLEERRGLRVDLPLRYAEAVRRAGGLPLGLYPTTDRAELEALVAGLDGLVLTGGDDFDMERLGLGPTHPAARPVHPSKQDGDFALIAVALERRLPVLGICYGMQCLALFGGGRLFQHLPEDRPAGRDHSGDSQHPVRAEPGTKLARSLGVEPVSIVSRHHQAVAAVGAPWRVAARDDEGLIEAVEHPELPFALGTQWHPELSGAEHPDRHLFAALIAAAREHRSARPSPAHPSSRLAASPNR